MTSPSLTASLEPQARMHRCTRRNQSEIPALQGKGCLTERHPMAAGQGLKSYTSSFAAMANLIKSFRRSSFRKLSCRNAQAASNMYDEMQKTALGSVLLTNHTNHKANRTNHHQRIITEFDTFHVTHSTCVGPIAEGR